MSTAGWLIAGGALSAVVVVVVVARLRHAGRTLDSIMTEHHDRMERLSQQAVPVAEDIARTVPVRRERGAHRRERLLPATDDQRRPMSA